MTPTEITITHKPRSKRDGLTLGELFAFVQECRLKFADETKITAFVGFRSQITEVRATGSVPRRLHTEGSDNPHLN